ncbi:MAG: TIGR00282 family metallophosphoesterase [Candidatus Loosdrechtia sp.]|uniref:TIGR00282 family metallophosphoesterase n=1 Tax=Candidatus Loosdrechtia sp. TaxID=3101272 RepID=UPI003A768D02|nr:MAG: TIGR00282 family metallophosphoesterase [Candidatus Jettenia sp. AMX2]
MKINVLVIGDIVGKPGRIILKNKLKTYTDKENIHFCIANGENAAGGAGITEDIAKELFSYGVDVITSGDHIWDKKDIMHFLETNRYILRPANYSPLAVGRGYTVKDSTAGIPIAVINLLGRVFMKPVDCPFRVVDDILKTISRETKAIFVDMHAEATSEKIAMGWYLDGRVSAVCGTHTHVPTADERILPKRTAVISDLGMTGPHESVLGRKIECVLKAIVTQMPVRFDVAEGDVRINGAMIVVDSQTGQAESIKRVEIKEDYK